VVSQLTETYICKSLKPDPFISLISEKEVVDNKLKQYAKSYYFAIMAGTFYPYLFANWFIAVGANPKGYWHFLPNIIQDIFGYDELVRTLGMIISLWNSLRFPTFESSYSAPD